ncbi:MAG: hypothetical protein KAR19_15515 [Bacteroidales bacterium]|nr:hypothetical protein [Bacteroidales bacterium]
MPVPGGIKAGRISKPNGLQGKVNIVLDPVAGKSIEPENPLFIDIDGQRIPFFMEEFTLVSDDQAIIKLEFINTIEEARPVCGCDVYLDLQLNPSKHESMNDLHAVVGYEAFDLQMGNLGRVTDYIESDMNPVLLIDYRGKEMMVPAAEELIVRIDHREQSIHFHLPEGLTTL